MEMEVKPKLSIEEGRHTGKITAVEFRYEPYEYTDVLIEIDGIQGVQLKYGAPTILSEGSKLYQLIAKFQELKIGEKINIENALIGKRISFMTLNEPGKKDKTKEFARIVDGSIKP